MKMFLTFNRSLLEKRLLGAPPYKLVVYGACICERLVPNYYLFYLETKYGNSDVLNSALDVAWGYLEGEFVSNNTLYSLIDECGKLAPISENFKSLYTTAAQDCCFSLCLLLEFLIEHDINKILQIAEYATDSVDLYVQETENISPLSETLEIDILNSALMQQELKFQNDMLELISSNQPIDIKKARQMFHQKSNLRLHI